MKIDPTAIVSQCSEQIFSDLDGETVLMDIKSGKYYGMDTTAHRIWELLASPVKVSDILDTLIETYEVESRQCERDVLQFLSTLADANLLVVHSRT